MQENTPVQTPAAEKPYKSPRTPQWKAERSPFYKVTPSPFGRTMETYWAKDLCADLRCLVGLDDKQDRNRRKKLRQQQRAA